MSAALVTVAVLWAFLMLPVLAICADSKRRDIAAAQARHPSTWQPATEDAIEQAVAIVDDGKALVREAEAYLRQVAK